MPARGLAAPGPPVPFQTHDNCGKNDQWSHSLSQASAASQASVSGRGEKATTHRTLLAHSGEGAGSVLRSGSDRWCQRGACTGRSTQAMQLLSRSRKRRSRPSAGGSTGACEGAGQVPGPDHLRPWNEGPQRRPRKTARGRHVGRFRDVRDARPAEAYHSGAHSRIL